MAVSKRSPALFRHARPARASRTRQRGTTGRQPRILSTDPGARGSAVGANDVASRGLLGSTPTRKIRSLRSFRPLRGPSRAMMATRLALEPEDAPALVALRPAPDSRVRGAARAASAIDMWLLSIVVCLLVLGTVFVYSASMYQSYYNYENVNYWFTRQIAFLGVGVMALFAGLLFDYRRLRRFSMLGLGLTAVLLVLGHVPHFSVAANGAARWVKLGPLTLQPSEIGKLALTIYAAHWLSSKDDEIKHSVAGLVPFGAVLLFTTLMIFRQPDLGTAAIVSLAMLGMFFISGARVRHLLMVAAMLLPVAYFVTHSGGYWQGRINAWRHPFADTQGVGYEISRALLAFWHGGWTGVGLGNGQLKETIPAAQTDTIFATIGEETGMIGALGVVALFGAFAYRGIRISMLAQEAFGKLLAAGITIYLVCQALVNMLSVTNSIPFTGVPLPFISYGGTSLVINLLAVGILLNISRQIRAGA